VVLNNTIAGCNLCGCASCYAGKVASFLPWLFSLPDRLSFQTATDQLQRLLCCHALHQQGKFLLQQVCQQHGNRSRVQAGDS
jgi:hypothetical protein